MMSRTLLAAVPAVWPADAVAAEYWHDADRDWISIHIAGEAETLIEMDAESARRLAEAILAAT